MNSLRSPLIFIFKSLFYLMSPKWGSHQTCPFLFEIGKKCHTNTGDKNA